MPGVQSKSMSGREKKPPPTPRPKPILKTRRVAWDTHTNDATDVNVNSAPNTDKTPQDSQSRFSLLPKPYVNVNASGTQSFLNSPTSPNVKFYVDVSERSKRGKLTDTKVAKHGPKHEFGIGQGVVQNGVLGEDVLAGTDQSVTCETVGEGTEQMRNQKHGRTTGPRTSFCGLEALQECEEHTDWANEVLKRNNLTLISDLRKSISDGLTLPAILEIVSGVTLHCVQTSVSSKEERIENLGRCLEFLSKRGADVSQIDAAELEDGSLKTSLLLVGTVRKHFEKSYQPSQNGHHSDHVDPAEGEAPVPSSTTRAPPPLPPRNNNNMPGATKLAGAVPTPFMAGRDALQRPRQSLSSSPPRKGLNQSEEILPGVLGSREPSYIDNNNKPHTAIISTTELGTNGVAQHGVEERRQHLAATSPGPNSHPHSHNHPSSRGGVLLRHPNARSGGPGGGGAPGGLPQEMAAAQPQGAVTRAWTASPRPQAQNGTGGGGTFENRLRQLITSDQSKNGGTQPRESQATYNPAGAGVNAAGGGSMFHGGGSEVFDDGDVLVVPPRPQSRNSPDFEIMMAGGGGGNHSYGPGYRHPGQSPRGHRSQGYVPSRPAERQQGARADSLLATSSPTMARPPPGAQYPRGPGTQQPAEASVPGSMLGHDNFGYALEGQGQVQGQGQHGQGQVQGQQGSRGRIVASRPGAMPKPGGPQRPGGNDLRNAWQKLYGRPPHSGQTSPAGGAPSPMTRGDNLRSSYNHEHQGRQSQQSPYMYRSKPAGQAPPGYNNRPVSAPAPAHMQVHFEGPNIFPPGPLNPTGGDHRVSQEQLDTSHGGRSSLNTSAQRESPMGQSSSTQGQLEESSSSQQSGNSNSQGQAQGQGHIPAAHGHSQLHTGKDGYGGKNHISSPSLSPTSPQSNTSQTFAIGPAAKYPEHNSRPSSARKDASTTSLSVADNGRPLYKDGGNEQHGRDETDRAVAYKGQYSTEKGAVFKGQYSAEQSDKVRRHSGSHQFANDLTTALQAASKKHQNTPPTGNNNNYNRPSHNKSYERLYERSHDQSREMPEHSIFDYEASHSETSGSVTPPLPPLSPTVTPPDSPLSEAMSPLPRSFSLTNVSSGDKLSELERAKASVDKKKPRRTSELQFRMDRKPHSKKTSSKSGFRLKGANLKEVRESDTESDLSFDIENTILTVESHDTEQPHPAGDLLTTHEASALRQQLQELETKYHDLKLRQSSNPGPGVHHGGPHGHPQGPGPPPIGRQRRWSIGSSDTSSFRREAKLKPGKQIQHKHHSREFKNINKRFQRLESHVVTLARSVAHLSSELRTHNSMVNDLDGVKRELREIRDHPGRPFPGGLLPGVGASLGENDGRFGGGGSGGWVPGLTNPKRVNKLTKFFGEEPPLLQLFLKKLGYERYVPNFESEHIGMIELPYMTEDRLEKIGVPMGPRLRILQEAQICFKFENFHVYMV